jgi:hypothetical protein
VLSARNPRLATKAGGEMIKSDQDTAENFHSCGGGRIPSGCAYSNPLHDETLTTIGRHLRCHETRITGFKISFFTKKFQCGDVGFPVTTGIFNRAEQEAEDKHKPTGAFSTATLIRPLKCEEAC